MRSADMDAMRQLLADLPTLYTHCPLLVRGNLISTLMVHLKTHATADFFCGYTRK